MSWSNKRFKKKQKTKEYKKLDLLVYQEVRVVQLLRMDQEDPNAQSQRL